MKMKLSQAMRKGTPETVKGTGSYYLGIQDGKVIACSMGAAWIGQHGVGSIGQCSGNALEQEWPEMDQRYPDPISGTEKSLWNVIVILNDQEEWSNEQIAEYLEGLGL